MSSFLSVLSFCLLESLEHFRVFQSRLNLKGFGFSFGASV